MTHILEIPLKGKVQLWFHYAQSVNSCFNPFTCVILFYFVGDLVHSALLGQMRLACHEATEILLSAKNRRLRLIRTYKDLQRSSEVERERPESENGISKVGGLLGLGKVLFVLSDSNMHFSLLAYEENNCKPLKTTYRRSEGGFSLWLVEFVFLLLRSRQGLYASVRVCVCVCV